jgi:hypothetical protein
LLDLAATEVATERGSSSSGIDGIIVEPIQGGWATRCACTTL